ncbi:MFS transporter [Nocardia sp. NPDC052254]|uniref:MFS transporter n=1 Tax=Nocardia sp. NPDC052254 TaxID=3155681 RepID=UPI00342282B7
MDTSTEIAGGAGGITRDVRRMLTIVVSGAGLAAGVYLTSGILYFSRIAHISSGRIGFGLSIAGGLCVAVVVAAGRVSDRFGPGPTLRWSLVFAAIATAALPWVRDGGTFLVIVPITSAAHAGAQLAVATMVSRLGDENANEVRGYLRSVLNVGLALGAGASGLVAQSDSPEIYRVIFLGTAVLLLAVAALVGRLPHIAPPVTRHDGAARAVLRDRPYLALAALDGVLALQHSMQAVAVPLWIVSATTAPRWSIAAADIANTVIVVLFQVRVCRRVATPTAGARAYVYSGWAVLCACLVVSMAADHSTWLSLLLVGIAAVVLAVGELWHSAAGFEVSNALAPAHAVGHYLGVYGAGLRIAQTAGPALVAWLCLGLGKIGWLISGVAMLGAGLLAPYLIAWAVRTRPTAPSTSAVQE